MVNTKTLFSKVDYFSWQVMKCVWFRNMLIFIWNLISQASTIFHIQCIFHLSPINRNEGNFILHNLNKERFKMMDEGTRMMCTVDCSVLYMLDHDIWKLGSFEWNFNVYIRTKGREGKRFIGDINYSHNSSQWLKF